MSLLICRFFVLLLLFIAHARAEEDSAVVFNEIHYHPRGAASEWIELHNIHGVNVDLSGWKMRGGVNFDFAAGTIIAGRGYLVVAAVPGDASLAGAGALGPWTGSLDNSGEEIRLVNRDGRLMERVDYRDSGDWPAGADDGGVTLAKRVQDSAASDAENWTVSAEIGGTPARRNFASLSDPPITTTVAVIESTWKYEASNTALPASWKDAGYDDSTWASGPGVLYAGNAQITGGGQGLLGYWPLNETAGTVAPNTAPGGTAAQLINGPTWVADATRGQVLRFDGANDYADAGSATIPQMTLANDFTWSFWASSFTSPGTNVILGNRFKPSGGDWSPLEFIKFTPTSFEFYRNGGQEGIDYADIAANSGWIHHAVVKTGGSLQYFRNGVAAGARTITQSLINPQPLYFGSDKGQEAWPGQLDDVAIWTRALTAGEVGSLTDGSKKPDTVGAPGTLATQVPLGASTFYFRRAFTFTGTPAQTELQLRTLIDDGAVIYLNGQEIHRVNMPAGPAAHTTPAASTVTDAALSTAITLPGSALLRGSNVLAVEVHQDSPASPDMVFALSLVATETPAPPGATTGLVISEVSRGSDADFRVELANVGTTAIDLTGYVLASSNGGNGFTLPAQTLQPGQFLVVSAAELGVTPPAGGKLFLYAPGRSALLDAQVVDDTLRGRAANGRWLFPSAPTFGQANLITFHTAVVINEIMYQAHPTVVGDEQWIEILNRSAAPVNLSGWKFTAGVTFTFPTNTTLAPGDYLVVTNDAAALRAKWPAVATKIVGNFGGSISGKGERLELADAAGNPANTVTFADGGRWPEAPDGAGSSLELRDPDADNSAAEAWAASHEAARGSWQTFTWEGPATVYNGDPTQWNEFIFGLLDAGTYLIDDISVIDVSNGVNLIQNGTFNTGLGGWRFLGTQGGASVVNDPAGSGPVLQIVSTGPTEHMHNHAETTLKNGTSFVTINSAATYRISLRACWVSGANRLNARLYFNRLSRTWILPVGAGGGTPGGANSTFSPNIGPTPSGLTHTPPVPAAGQAAIVSVAADDPDGVAALTLFYSVNGATAFTSVPMALENGRYAAAIPGQGVGAKAQFYVQAVDSVGASSFFPSRGPASRAIVPWADGQARLTLNGVAPHNLRIVMTGADTATLHTPSNVMSNHRLPCTVVLDESVIFYDSGVRLKGSERGRNQPSRVSFNVAFPADQKLFGVHKDCSIDRSGAGNQTSQKEIMIKHAITHAGDIPGGEDDLCRVIAPQSAQTGPAILVKQRFDSDYLNNKYTNGSDGRLFKYELIYYPTTTTGGVEGLKLPEPDNVVGVGLSGLGPSNTSTEKEYYRWHWLQENNHEADDYSALISFLMAFSRPADAQYFTAVAARMDVDEWLRSFAIGILFGIGDNYATGSQHNFLIYRRPSDGRHLFFPHDMDFTFSAGATSSLTPNGDLNKLLTNAGYKRTYYSHVFELCSTTYNTTYLLPWAQHYSKFLNEDLTGFMGYIDQRRSFAVSAINTAIPQVAFDITTPNGTSSAGPLATIQGKAWVDMRELRLSGSSTALEVVWLDQTTWQAQVPIAPGPNTITLQAFTAQNALIGTDSVTINGTGAVLPADATNLVISEIMYHPGPPTSVEQAAGFTDDEAFEYLEVQNISATSTISLAGLQFTAGVTFTLPNVTLAPGARGLLVGNQAAFTQRYGNVGAAILGQFQPGSFLANGGDRLRLLAAGGAVVRDFGYDDAPPWPTSSDGAGFSLVLIRPSANPDHADPVNWRASTSRNGNPGTSDATGFTGNPEGDDNRDGISNLLQYALAGTGTVQLPTAGASGAFLSMSFQRNLAADDLTFVVERSIDLLTWTSGSDVAYVSESPLGDGTANYVWRSTHPRGETPREFLRLKVTKP